MGLIKEMEPQISKNFNGKKTKKKTFNWSRKKLTSYGGILTFTTDAPQNKKT